MGRGWANCGKGRGQRGRAASVAGRALARGGQRAAGARAAKAKPKPLPLYLRVAQRAADRRLQAIRDRCAEEEEAWLTDGVGAPPPEQSSDSELPLADEGSGQSSESDTFADVLPGLRAAVVTRGIHLMGSWGESSPARAPRRSRSQMRAADYAAMSMRLDGTARGSTFAYLAEDCLRDMSPQSEGRSRSRSANSGSDSNDGQRRRAAARAAAATPATPAAAAGSGGGQRVDAAVAVRDEGQVVGRRPSSDEAVVAVQSSGGESAASGQRAASQGQRSDAEESLSPELGYSRFSGKRCKYKNMLSAVHVWSDVGQVGCWSVLSVVGVRYGSGVGRERLWGRW